MESKNKRYLYILFFLRNRVYNFCFRVGVGNPRKDKKRQPLIINRCESAQTITNICPCKYRTPRKKACRTFFRFQRILSRVCENPCRQNSFLVRRLPSVVRSEDSRLWL